MSTNYGSYLKICRAAAENDEIFKDFKRHPDYTPILEHVNYQQGLDYLKEIKQNHPLILKYINEFITNDRIGNPNVYYFNELKLNISPTTLRYIKILADLINLFGCLNGIDIVEIGGGYGGQCKIIYDWARPKSFTIIDLPEVLQLSKKYFDRQGINNIILRNIDDPAEIHYDLYISNYAFSEIERNYQIFYADKIIKNSAWGYMICNSITRDNFNRDEIIALKQNHQIFEEKPLTGDGNFIYTWKS